MPRLHETIETSLPAEDAFAFIADFANSQVWDPGVATAERIDPGPVGLGARYRVDVLLRGKVAPMEYRITTFEPSDRVVLTGEGSDVSAVDEIRFEPIPTGTRIDYTADIRLGGCCASCSRSRAARSRSSPRTRSDGMQTTLDERAKAAGR